MTQQVGLESRAISLRLRDLDIDDTVPRNINSLCSLLAAVYHSPSGTDRHHNHHHHNRKVRNNGQYV